MMKAREAVQVLHEARGDCVVITSMGSAREWMALGPMHPLDLVYVPSSMGQATSVALGLAIARPDLGVVVCSGDGSLLMNLGTLVTIASQAPKNLVVVVFENGVYEVTGAQPIPARVDLCGLARAAGIASVHAFNDVEEWRGSIRTILAADGPTFVCLGVEPVAGGQGPRSPSPARERARAFAAAIARAC